MTTNFTSLPVIDLGPLCVVTSGGEQQQQPSAEDLSTIAAQLCNVFETVGFAYLINYPLSFSHDDVFGIAREFFGLPLEDKMSVAKRTFRPSNENTYRGYFPAQEGAAPDNLKEGFEMGPPDAVEGRRKKEETSICSSPPSPFVLTEENVFPSPSPPSAQHSRFGSRDKLEKLYAELQGLSTTLLRLLATAVGKPEGLVDYLLEGSVSTLRLLHYPPPSPVGKLRQREREREQGQEQREQGLCCTPHTDSGLLTLLHQDATGGLEVRNAAGEWVVAPYVPGSLVVNIGDLMAEMSERRFVATMHRVRSSSSSGDGNGRYSVPFFFEPGVDALVGREGEEVRYGDFLLGKMRSWVEFQEVVEKGGEGGINQGCQPQVDVSTY